MARSDRARSAAPKQDVEWLTPAPDSTPVQLRWPDESGPFLLTCHLARVDGRTMLVGLDVRSFVVDTDGNQAPGPLGVVELNHPALRSLRAGEIAEAARAKLAALVAAQRGSKAWDESVRDAATRTFEVLTSPNRSRATARRPASQHLQRVAELYLEAVAAGGEISRKPSIFVHRALTQDGTDVSLNTVRGQIHRARVKGLIPAAQG